MKIILGTCFLVTLLLSDVMAQNICTQNLRQARAVYDEGRIHELPALLQNCLNNGFSDEEKVEAYRLLALGYIFLDEPTKADEAMLNLLKTNPEFELNETLDPAEFIALYKTFRTKPIYLWGPKVGGTYSFGIIQQLYGINDSFGSSNTSYSPDPSFEAALMIEKAFTDRLGAMGEVGYSNNKYTVQKNFFDNNNTLYAKTTSIETKTWISVNIAGTFRVLPTSQFDPIVSLGASVRYLLVDNAKLETTFPEGGEQATGTDEDLVDFRNQIGLGAFVAVSARKKIGRQYLLLEAKYTHGLNNITAIHYDNGPLSTFYGYALDDISVSYFTLSLGLLIPKYSPKKLNR